MSKRIFVLVAVLFILLIMVGTASADQGWGTCQYTWYRYDSGWKPYTIYGDAHYAYQEDGNWSLACNLDVDFKDPTVLTLDQACAFAPENCNGGGTFIRERWGCYGPDGSTTCLPPDRIGIGYRPDPAVCSIHRQARPW